MDSITIFGYSMKIDVLLLLVVLWVLLSGHLVCSCSRVGMMEGLEMIAPKTATMPSVTTTVKDIIKKSKDKAKDIAKETKESFSNYAEPEVNTSLWGSYPKTTGRPGQPVPLPEGEMLMFATTDFKPECCPGAYTNGSGCACMTDEQYQYLINRGGNNVPYSEY